MEQRFPNHSRQLIFYNSCPKANEHIKFQERRTRLWRMRTRNFRGTSFISNICKNCKKTQAGFRAVPFKHRGTQAE